MTAAYDVIVIGSGHNGLVCGAYLARSGLRTLVLERRGIVGGAAVTEEFSPGFRASRFSYVMSLLHPRIIRDLELSSLGLQVLPANDLFCPLGGNDYILYSGDLKKTQAEFARFSRHDAEIYPQFARYLEESAAVVRQLLFETPVDPVTPQLGELQAQRSATVASSYDRRSRLPDRRSVDAECLRLPLRLVRARHRSSRCSPTTPRSAPSPGPKSPGTAYVIMHHLMGEHEGAGGWGFVRGGMGAITAAIARSGARFGMEVMTEAAVAEVLVSAGRATGVRTTDGREFHARAIACNAAAPTLYKRLIAPAHLPAELLRDIDTFRTFSTAFKMNIAAHEPPRYRAFDAARLQFSYPTYVHIAPGIDYLERAYDDAKYGWYSSRPFLTPVVPTIVDDSLAPPGKHVINVFGGHAPYRLRDGASWADEKHNLTRAALDVIETMAPGFSAQVIDIETLVAPDLEAIVGLPQGHIFHGELSADQLFWQRPAPHWADYRTPIAGLYLCGSSAHPGGGVSGIPGHNAAREIRRDWKSLKVRRVV